MKGVKLIRSGERVAVREIDREEVELLFRSEVMEGIRVELEPMTGFSGSYRHKGEEMHVVLKGEVEFTVEDEIFLCREGDILWHRSDLAHGIRNPGVERASYLTMLAPPALK
jgi:mannose-6-phosphate isomerase-like protein (cupin superfamily)